ncbi:MAG: glutamate synthase-related protein [Candidatus Hydrothermarchaeota archaeon]|nr:glutamate synthase-related protein [Candidatus Hydrothermarchaeota archaeon]
MNSFPPEFRVTVDMQRCTGCLRCTLECPFGVHVYLKEEFKESGENKERRKHFIVRNHENCVACQRCVYTCPVKVINIEKRSQAFSPHPIWTQKTIKDIKLQANTGGVILASMGNEKPYRNLFDHLVIDACQVTNPAIDPLREPMELRTYIGRKPGKLELDANGNPRLATDIPPNLKLETPIMIAHMSYGAISLEAHKALAKAAKMRGTFMGTGEGGLHKDLYPYADHIIAQVASGRFGVHEEYLKVASAIEIKIGQGGKPGIGGHLPGKKINAPISETRMIPVGSDALSPAPHHDIYSIEDLSRLIYALKEASRYKKPVFVKIAAVHNSAPIATGIIRAGADAVVLDGFTGGTGAAPQVIRDNLGIPIETAIASVDQRLREEGIRHWGSIIASGSIRNSGDVAKAIALGADAIYIGTGALISLGCTVCKQCYTGKCAWGIATQDPNLRKRLDPEKGAIAVANLIKGWSHELQEILGALGLNSLESLRGNRDRLRGVGLNQVELDVLGVLSAGK